MGRRLGDLAETLELRLEGDPQLEITSLAGLGDAGTGDLSFVTGPRYAKAFGASAASAYLVPLDFDAQGRAVLRSATPYLDFARAVVLLYPRARPAPEVHPTAVVAADAELADDVWIGPYVVIGERTRVGPRTRIHPHVTLYPDVVIGSDCEIHSGAQLREGVRMGDRAVVQNGAVLGSEGFGFAYDADGRRVRIPHRMGVHAGNDVEIGANTTIDASHPGQGRHDRGYTTTWIGDHVKIDNLTQVGHGVSLGEGTLLCAQVGLAGSTEVGRHVTFGGKSATGGHMQVGDGALIGGMCGAQGDVEPGQQLLGYPGMDRRLYLRVWAAWKRLPELLRRVARIERQLGMAGDKG